MMSHRGGAASNQLSNGAYCVIVVGKDKDEYEYEDEDEDEDENKDHQHCPLARNCDS